MLYIIFDVRPPAAKTRSVRCFRQLKHFCVQFVTAVNCRHEYLLSFVCVEFAAEMLSML